mgnify:CR=1 FL=1
MTDQAEATTTELKDLMALMIWKMRHFLPTPLIQIMPADRVAFQQSCEYNEQKPLVMIEERKGATLIHLMDDKGDQIIFTENNEADLDRAEAANKFRLMKQNAPMLASQIRSDLSQGTISQDTLEEACRTLEQLGRT